MHISRDLATNVYFLEKGKVSDKVAMVGKLSKVKG